MNIRTLKEFLDDYGDHLEVLVRDEDSDTEYQTVSMEAGTGEGGVAIAILFVSELADENEWNDEEDDDDGG